MRKRYTLAPEPEAAKKLVEVVVDKQGRATRVEVRSQLVPGVTRALEGLLPLPDGEFDSPEESR